MVTNRNFFKFLGRKAAILGLASASLLGVGCGGVVGKPDASDPPAVGGPQTPGEPSGPTDPAGPNPPSGPVGPGENRAPVITSSPVTEVNEGSAYSYQVTANDPDKDSMDFTLPTKPEWLSMNSSGLISGVAPDVNLDTNVNLEARVSDGEATTSHPFTVTVKDVLTIPPSGGGGGGGGGGAPPSPPPSTPPRMLTVSGTLQNSETDAAAAGEVRAYRNNGDGTYTLLKKEIVGSNGVIDNMSFEHSGNFDLQARLKDGSSDASYVRTIPLSSTSTLTGLTIRAVPYTDLDKTQTVDNTDTKVSIPEFKAFMEDVNRKFYSVRGESKDATAFRRWNFNDLNGIEILRYNPVTCTISDTTSCEVRDTTSCTVSFSDNQQNHIESRIKASGDVNLLFNERKVTVQKDTSANQNTFRRYTCPGDTITPKLGWIVVVPVQDLSHLGVATEFSPINDGYIGSFRIDLKSNPDQESDIYDNSSRTITHEFAHTTLYPGGRRSDAHTSGLAHDQSITSEGVVLSDSTRKACTEPCNIDKKAAKLIYEETFSLGTHYDKILGTNFHSQE